MTPDEILQQLDQVEKGGQAKTPDQLLAELDAVEQGVAWYEPALETAVKVGNVIDSYTVAPTMSYLSARQQGADRSTAAAKFAEQFGEDPSLAPTGKSIAEREGFSTEGFGVDSNSGQLEKSVENIGGNELTVLERPSGIIEKGDPLDISPAGAVGFALETVTDPTNLIVPGGKAALKGTQALVRLSGKGVRGAGRLALKSSQAVKEAVELAEKTKQAAQGVSRPVVETTKSVTSALNKAFRPVQVKDLDRIKNILKRNNIDPTDIPKSLEFGKDSSIGVADKVLREGPLGDEPTKLFEAFLQKIDNVTGGIVSVGGRKLDPYEAGNIAVDGYNKGVKEFFDGIGTTYRSIAKDIPGLKVTDDGIMKFSNYLDSRIRHFEDLAKNGYAFQKTEAKAALENLRSLTGIDGSYENLINRLQTIGEPAFRKGKAAENLPLDQKEMRKIYDKLREVAVDSVKAVDPKAAKELVENNKAMSEFLENTKKIGKIIKKGDSGEVVFNKLIKNSSIDDIKNLKEALPADVFDSQRMAYLQSLLASNEKGISYTRTLNNLKKNERKLAVMFQENRALLDNLIDVLEVGKRTGETILNFSGTDRSGRFRQFLGEVLSSGTTQANLEVAAMAARKRTTDAAKKAAKKASKPSTLTKKITPKKARNIPLGTSAARGLERALRGEMRGRDEN